MIFHSLKHSSEASTGDRASAKTLYGIALGVFCSLALVMTAGCSKPVALAEIPAYPGATELKEGESALGASLGQNMRTDAAIRTAAGIGGKTEQKGYRLPANTTWFDVRSYYEAKLKDSGWSSGNGASGDAADMANNVLNAANSINPITQTAIWSSGNQTLTVTMITNPVQSTEKTVILSQSGM